MGRPRTPTKLKLLNGNPGKRPLPEDEPQPELGVPEMPSWLSAEAKKEWKRMSSELMELRILSVTDRAVLTLWCETWADWREMKKRLTKRGRTYTNKKSGVHHYRPETVLAREAEKTLCRLICELGQSPASRSRTKVIGKGLGKNNPFADFA